MFAAQRSTDNALTVMVIAKALSGSTPVTINLSNFTPASAVQRWQLTSANSITRLSDLATSGQSLTTSVPAQSVTLFVVAASAGPANQPPVAAASATPSSGVAPLAVAFSAAGSSDADGTIAGYAWTFGDGGSATGSTASHTYTSAGTYAAQLVVTDNQGATAAKSLTITVTAQAAPPAAPTSLTASASSGRVVTLGWVDNASNETGFYVERAVKAKNLQFERIATVGANVRTYSRTEAAGQWVYRVQAFNATGTSGYSNSVTLRVR